MFRIIFAKVVLETLKSMKNCDLFIFYKFTILKILNWLSCSFKTGYCFGGISKSRICQNHMTCAAQLESMGKKSASNPEWANISG